MESARVKRLVSEWSGKALNGWTVGEYINCGKSALVFKATKGAIDAAVKIFDPEIVERFGRADEAERIRRELTLVGTQHENLVKIFDGGKGTRKSVAHIDPHPPDSRPALGRGCIRSRKNKNPGSPHDRFTPVISTGRRNTLS